MAVFNSPTCKTLKIYQSAHHWGISHSPNYVRLPPKEILGCHEWSKGQAGCRDCQARRTASTRGQCGSRWSLTQGARPPPVVTRGIRTSTTIGGRRLRLGASLWVLTRGAIWKPKHMTWAAIGEGVRGESFCSLPPSGFRTGPEGPLQTPLSTEVKTYLDRCTRGSGAWAKQNLIT